MMWAIRNSIFVAIGLFLLTGCGGGGSAAPNATGGIDPPPVVIDGPVIIPTGVIELFDGNSLDGLYTWLELTGYDDPTGVFRIENNLLLVTGTEVGEVITSNRYRDYHLILEFKWGNNTFGPRATNARDSGLLIHGNGVDGGAQDGKWMSGLQSQMIEGGMGDLIIIQGVDASGNLLPQSIDVETESVACVLNNWGCWYGPPETYRWQSGGNLLTFSQWDLIHHGNWDPAWQDIKGFRSENTLENPNGSWNQMVVVADGATVEVYFNGTKVNEATNVFPAMGRIQLQIEWAELYVRRWELWPVGQVPAPINPDPATLGSIPGSDPNSINYSSTGMTSVAILTTDTFYALDVDALSVWFGDRGVTESHGRAHVEDVDGDGDMELLLHFNTQDTGIQCGDTVATLSGMTFGGQAFTGSDVIRTMKCR